MGTSEVAAGHSPVYTHVKEPGYRQARTMVNFNNINGTYLYTAYSQWQYC